MKRRIVAASVAIMVALISGVLLLNYVASADQRAMAGMQTREVLVVTGQVAEGTAASQLGDRVALRELPAKAVAQGAVSDLSKLAGSVTNTDLEPGEQVLSTRFSDPASLRQTSTVKVPKGFSEVSVLLEPQRVVGSNLSIGDRVGVIISVGDNAKDARTHLTLNQVLITNVQGATASEAAAQPSSGTQQSSGAQRTGGASAQPVPDSSLMVTLAVSAQDAEQVVFAAEYGKIWLTLENKASTNTDTRIVTEKTVQQ